MLLTPVFYPKCFNTNFAFSGYDMDKSVLRTVERVDGGPIVHYYIELGHPECIICRIKLAEVGLSYPRSVYHRIRLPGAELSYTEYIIYGITYSVLTG